MASEHNARLTPIRKHIYRCLLEAEAPLGAYELLDMLDGVGLALLLCDKCGHAEPFDAGPAILSLGAAAKSKGFESHQTVIEIIGRCAEHSS